MRERTRSRPKGNVAAKLDNSSGASESTAQPFATELQRAVGNQATGQILHRDASQAIKPQPVMNITATQGAETTSTGAKPKNYSPGLLDQMEAKESELRASYAKLAPQQVELEEANAKAGASVSADAKQKKADIDKQVGTIQCELKQLDADRRALASPATDQKTRNAIYARANAPVSVGQKTEVDRHNEKSGFIKHGQDMPMEQKRDTYQKTTTTTGYGGGKSTTNVHDRVIRVGKELEEETLDSREKVTANGRVMTSVRGTRSLSKDGYSQATVSKREHVVDGKVSSIEKKRGFNVGLNGASSSKQRAVVNADGSGSSQASSLGVERGEGKAGGVYSRTNTATDAQGNVRNDTFTGKSGLISGKDGQGAYAEGQRGIENKGKDGVTTGAVAGLRANIICNVKAIEGTSTFDLSVSINLGASLSASRKREVGNPDKGTGTVGMTGSASLNHYVTRHYVLSETDAAAYVAGLKAASAGGGDNTRTEFAIIRVGIAKGWDAAQQLAGPVRPDDLRPGESVETGAKRTLGYGLSAGAGGLAIEGGHEWGHDESMTVAKDKDGKLTYEISQGDSDKKSGGLKASIGVVEGGVNASSASASSTGYKFLIDPASPDAHEQQLALAACKSQGDLQAFAKRYPQTVQSRTVGTGVVDSQGAAVSIGPAKAALNFSNGVETQQTRDNDGKLIGQSTTGTNSGGVEFSLGKYRVGDSTAEKAVAQVDGEGNANVDVTSTHTSTDMLKFRDALPLVGKKDQRKHGALTKLAGGAEPDTDIKNVAGLHLTGGDLQYLAAIACSDNMKWMSACSSKFMTSWQRAGHAIRRAGGSQAAVARELASFVGGPEGTNRSRVIYRLLRPAGDVSSGFRFEFPGGLAAQKADYDSLVVAESEARLDGLGSEPNGKVKAAAAATELLNKLDSLYQAIDNAAGFTQPAVKAEMLRATTARKSRVRAKLNAIGGLPEGFGRSGAMAEYNDLFHVCKDHKFAETKLFEELSELNAGSGNAIPIAEAIKQLRDLHAGWEESYKKMADLAQTHGFGEGIYWKYRPDFERFARAIHGAPGKETPPQPETRDLRASTAAAKAADEEAARTKYQQELNERIKKSKEMQYEGETLSIRIKKLANDLNDLATANDSLAALGLYDEAEAKFKRADTTLGKCRNNVPEMTAHGPEMLREFRESLRLVQQGIALESKRAKAKK